MTEERCAVGPTATSLFLAVVGPIAIVRRLPIKRSPWSISGGSAPWKLRRAAGPADATTADVLVLPPGYTPAHLDERLGQVS